MDDNKKQQTYFTNIHRAFFWTMNACIRIFVFPNFHIFFLMFFLLCIFTSLLSAQNLKIDSLKILLRPESDALNRVDTTRIKLLNQLAVELKNINPDTSIVLSKEALRLAKKRKWKKGIASSLGYLGVNYSDKGDYSKALEHYFEALKIEYDLLKKAKQNQNPKNIKFIKTKIAANLGNIGSVYLNQGDYSKALEQYFQALEINKEFGNKRGIAAGYGTIGIVYFDLGNYRKSLKHYFKALEINQELNNKGRIAIWLNNIGLIYMNQGDYPKALEHFFEALEINKELGNKSYIATALSNIGIIYHEQGDYIKALKYYFKALEISQEVGNKSEIARNLGNIGVGYRRHGDYPKALRYYIKALEIQEGLGNKIGIETMFGNIGQLYNEQGDYPKALEYYFKALEIAQNISNKNGITFHSINIGDLYIDLQQYTQAEEYLKTSLTIAEEYGFVKITRSANQYLSKLFGKLGATKSQSFYEQAFTHHEKYLQANDQLHNEEKSKTIGKLEARHEFALEEIESRKSKNKKLRIEKAQIAKRDTLQYNLIYIIVVVVLFIAAIVLFAKFNISKNLKSAVFFITLLLVFEFVLVLADSKIEQISEGDPIYKLGMNLVMAMVFYFVQVYLGRLLSLHRKTMVAPISTKSSKVKHMFFLFGILSFILLSAFIPKFSNNVVVGGSQPDSLQITNQTSAHIDSLKSTLFVYQNTINEHVRNNQYKDAYVVIQEYGIVKDSIQALKLTQELNKLSEKLNLEEQQVKDRLIAEEQQRQQFEVEKRSKLLKYSVIFIIITTLFIGLSLLASKAGSKLSLPKQYLEGGLFVAFLLLFEFIIILTDPYIEGYSGNAPAWKLGFNMVLAIAIFRAHRFLEGKIRGRLFALKRKVVNR